MGRYLVVANQTLAGDHLVAEVRQRMANDPDASFYVVVPATHPRDHMTWTEGEARALAQDRLDQALERLRTEGASVEGEVGDENPVQAIDDALRAGDFQEIILSTLPAGTSRWLRQDLPTRVERRFELPVTHVVGEPDSE